ncbi:MULTISPECIES: ROK family protein [unclassified Fibrobacter]|uniref:ROK family protein n=1 Tax=unclassified Fibrobacter TaxID=2634177 RepID=UPI000D7A2108|nr:MULTISPECIES: ROK family protein [unclassified Fibrobacter]PWJ65585.1 putative NBD/HSP70 family sugar kinase [Fibrobacter sp. UWR4]
MTKEIKSAAEIKANNVATIKRALLDMKTATKPEVAEKTKLSVVTCGTILNELTANGTIVEESLRLSSGGRPAMSYRFSENIGYALCLYTYTDGDCSYIRYQILDVFGNILDSKAIQEKSITIPTLINHIQEIRKPYTRIKVIVLGVQGCINKDIIEFTDLPELSGHNLKKEIEEATGIFTRVHNDMKTVALGFSKISPEIKNGNADEHLENNIALLFFPQGRTPAGSFIVDGHILRGSSNLAGELSFFPFSVEKEKLPEIFSSLEKAQSYVDRLFVATTVFLDPAVIFVTGGLSNWMNAEKIVSTLQERLNRSQLPKIIIQPRAEVEYFAGLYSIAVDHLLGA